MVEATVALPAALKGNLQFSSNIVSAGASEHNVLQNSRSCSKRRLSCPPITSCKPPAVIFLISSAIDKCPVPRKENFFFKPGKIICAGSSRQQCAPSQPHRSHLVPKLGKSVWEAPSSFAWSVSPRKSPPKPGGNQELCPLQL